MGQIKLLIVDDSLFMQKILVDLVQSDPQIKVVGTARNGEEALSKIENLHPDIVTMDIEMPKMDGLAAVQKIMEADPVPIVMVSALTQRDAELTLKGLEYGAIDYVHKPSGSLSLDIDIVKDELISKIKIASFSNVNRVKTIVHDTLNRNIKNHDKIISLTASTGGPPAITEILRGLPADVPPILIVQHMPKGITRFFAQRLSDVCKFQVKEAEEGDKIQGGLALIAPGGFHMIVTKGKRIALTTGHPVNFVRPSGDVTMISSAEAFGSKNIGVILTGIGVDGAKGIKAIKEKGGFTIAQDERTSVVYGMPKTAFETGC
ncbi:MAG: protein-glutamate methylesterase/protein-glutamine glutaminase, partial [Candidatus Bathyarchaeia archaeon]